MKGKVILVGTLVVLGGAAVALHSGHQPKCPLGRMLMKKSPEAKPVPAGTATLEDQKKPAQ
jgi:hypothetical protein